jgi:hypothetical protein
MNALTPPGSEQALTSSAWALGASACAALSHPMLFVGVFVGDLAARAEARFSASARTWACTRSDSASASATAAGPVAMTASCVAANVLIQLAGVRRHGTHVNPIECKKILALMTLDDADDVHVHVHVHVKLPHVDVHAGSLQLLWWY